MSRLVPPHECAQIALAISDIWQQAIWSHLPRMAWDQVPKPTFALNDDMHAWGRWTGGAQRLLEIKTELVLKHPWYAVIDVVLHETAHQLVEIFAPYCDEPPHGERFKWFCRLLGANATASGDYPPLDMQVFIDDAKEQESPIALRIRKLLALSNSPNENEAKMAMVKARELMAKHDMEHLEQPNFVKNSNDFVSITLGKPLKHITLDYSYLANILKDFYNVMIIWISVPTSFDPLTWGKALEVSGTPLDVRIASYTYDFLENYVEMAWENQPLLVRRSGGIRLRRDFAIGVYSAFHEVLEAQNRRPEMQALVHVEHPELDSYYNKRYPHVRRSSSNVKIDKMAMDAGAELGRNLSIPKGLEKEGKGRKMLH